ncbi:MAG: hypothetical protein SGBAC_006452 [Bacillariaceae sp.]
MATNFVPYQPSDATQNAITILMIPCGILSVLGSSLIIRSIRERSKWSPYRRLMFAMSACDIISTAAYVFQPFLGPSDSKYAYTMTIGNDATCTLVGAWTQLTLTAHWYSAALSFYFVSTIRYGVSEASFSRKYEKWIHAIIISFHIITAGVGIIFDVYFQRQIVPGCWVAEPPGGACSGMNCWSGMVAYVFGFPIISTVFIIPINTRLLYTHVKKVVVQGQKKAMESEQNLKLYQSSKQGIDLKDSDRTSVTKMNLSNHTSNNDGTSGQSNIRGNVMRSSDRQLERVRQVRLQSYLYVLSYLVTCIWTIIVQILNSQRLQDQMEHAGRVYLPVLILQAIFVPSQGVSNAMVFFRPKYMAVRKRFASQTKWWCVRRCIYGDCFQPVGQCEMIEDTRRIAPADSKTEAESGVSSSHQNKRNPSRTRPQGGAKSTGATSESENFFVNRRSASVVSIGVASQNESIFQDKRLSNG